MQAVAFNTSAFQETGPAFDFNDVRALHVIFSTMNGNGEPVVISSLDWVPDVSTDPTSAPIADPNLAAGIPTLGEWGIIILGLCAAIFGLIFIRRSAFLFSSKA